MKRITSFAAAALTLGLSVDVPVQAADSKPATVCLNVNEIQRTEATDDRTLLFHMRNGKVWRNTLRTVCPMLKTSPYTQVLNGSLVCANAQFIHVALTGSDCALGDFTPAPADR